MHSPRVRIGLALILALVLVGGVVVAVRSIANDITRVHVVAYVENSNGLYPGDEVRILGVPVGAIDKIEPQSHRVKISFWFDNQYKVPAAAKAAILSPQLITSRAIQLTPAYNGGPVMSNGAVIPLDRTAVPVEWDDLRQQLQKLTEALQPTQPGGVSTLGALVDTAADNLRGQGANIRNTINQLSEAFSIFGDHSNDTFTTIKNLSVLVDALHGSSDLLRHLNENLAAVTALLANDPNEVGQAVSDLNAVVTQATNFVKDNRDAIGTTVDRLASISTAVHDSLDDIKQTLHVVPTAFQNYLNIVDPAHLVGAGILVLTNVSNPIQFICGGIQAASRLNAEQSSKLCVQYLAPILKNRQYNFLPFGENLFVGAQARPNEITYSEDWLRPDYVPPQPAAPPSTGTGPAAPPAANTSAPPAEPPPAPAPHSTDPAAGLQGMILPSGSGS